MNSKLYNFIGIICFIPVWIFRGNLNYIEITFVIIFFYLLPLLIHLYFIKALLKKNRRFNNLILSYYLSLILLHGVDQNLGLYGFVGLFAQGYDVTFVMRLSGMLFFLSLNLILFLFIFYLKENGLKIFTVFLITVLLINIFDFRKNISTFPAVNVKNNKYINENFTHKNKKLVIILDEMSGINSLESSYPLGLKFNKKIETLFNKYEFAYYVNARSVSIQTEISIPTMLNFIYTEDEISAYKRLHEQNPNSLIKKSKNYFSDRQIILNKFFDNENNIVVYQTLAIDFCDHEKVIKCYQYNPFDRDYEYLEGFNNNFLSRSLSAYKNSLTIIGQVLMRVGIKFNIADNFLDPHGSKAAFPYLLKKIENGLKLEKANLFFVHFLVPHTPYSFDKSCKYKGSIESQGYIFRFDFQNDEERIVQHNIERNCVVDYLDIFLENLRKNEYWGNLEIFLLSDHGSRILHQNKNAYVSIFAAKTRNISPGLKEDKETINYLFHKLNN